MGYAQISYKAVIILKTIDNKTIQKLNFAYVFIVKNEIF